MTSHVVLFEVADIAASARLAERLAAERNVVLKIGGGDVMVVVAELGPEAEDLAVLLRDAEAWIEEESLSAIRYELDGRGYVLEAGEADWSADVAATGGAEIEERRARLLDALDSVDRAISTQGPQIRGLEGLRDDIVFALRLSDAQSS